MISEKFFDIDRLVGSLKSKQHFQDFITFCTSHKASVKRKKNKSKFKQRMK